MKSILFGLLLGALAVGCTAAAQDTMGGTAGDAGAMGAHAVSVTITNTTRHQAFSAPVVVAHDAGYRPFALGKPVYPELVPLAEDGMNADFETVARVEPSILDFAVASGALAPGQSVTLQVEVDDAHPLVSAFGMMVSTNDTVFYYGTDLSMAGPSGARGTASGGGGMAGESMGGSGSSGASGDMGSSSDQMGSDQMGSESAATGEGSDQMGSSSQSMASDQMASGAAGSMAQADLYDGTVRALDAGSEANTESCHDIPGPPCGSVGVRHPAMAEGVVSVSHGLKGGGDLDPAVYGWSAPVARVVVTTP